VTSSSETHADASVRLAQAARRLLEGRDSTTVFFRACAGMWSELAGPEGLDGDPLELFFALEAWETAVGKEKASCNDEVRALASRLSGD
jgi:hypothetical protein